MPNKRLTKLAQTIQNTKAASAKVAFDPVRTVTCLHFFGQEKTNKHKHFGRDGVRDKQEPSLGQTGPVPGTNRPFSVEFHSKIAILSRLSLGRVPVCPWDDCPARAVRKCLCVLCLFFFGPRICAAKMGTNRGEPSLRISMRFGFLSLKRKGPWLSKKHAARLFLTVPTSATTHTFLKNIGMN